MESIFVPEIGKEDFPNIRTNIVTEFVYQNGIPAKDILKRISYLVFPCTFDYIEIVFLDFEPAFLFHVKAPMTEKRPPDLYIYVYIEVRKNG